MSASWYDVLGVEHDATAEQVKAAWREATDKFEPGQGSGQFRMFNEAADVLLDPEKRAAYDAEIGVAPAASKTAKKTARAKKKVADEPVVVEEPAEAGVATAVLDKPEPASSESPATPRAPGRSAPTWLMVVLVLVATAVVVTCFVLRSQTGDASAVGDAGDEASASAERALPVVLSYNYQHLEADRDQAVRFLSAKYKKEYSNTFDKLIGSSDGQPGAAEQAKAVVKASVEDIGVVSAQTGRVRLIVFLDQTTSKDGAAPTLSLNRLTVSMVQSGNTWLIDNIDSY